MEQQKELLQKLAACAAACEMCADACLDEEDIKMMVPCIRLDRDCSRICHTTASLIASNSKNAGAILKVCEEICKKCSEECGKHKHDHCQKCATACRECADACSKYAA